MNKILKTLALGAAVMFSASALADSYLYWMCEDTGDFTDWTYAQVKIYSGDNAAGGTFLTAFDTSGTSFAPSFTDGSFYEQYAKLAGTYGDSYSFVLELWNTEGGVARSSAITWNAATAAIVSDMSSSPTAASFTGFTAIPEPTSGLLLLLGMSALALRRKQKIA